MRSALPTRARVCDGGRGLDDSDIESLLEAAAALDREKGALLAHADLAARQVRWWFEDRERRRTTRRRTRRVMTALIVLGVLVGAIHRWREQTTPPSKAQALPVVSPAPDRYRSVIASATSEIAVFASPRDDAPSRKVSPPGPAEPVVFRVLDVDGPAWLEVQLPVRPNGSTGWVRRSAVALDETRYHVRVLLADHRLEVFEGPELVFHAVVGVGADDTPTPGGRFYITDLVAPPTPNTVYGDYVFGLSGYSDVVRDYRGGQGVIGIHGTNDPSTVGTDVSHGCIRMTNEDIAWLVHRLPLGTPVSVVA